MLIVGAGISGLMAAMMTSKLGNETILVEEHKEVGYPSHCGGIVAPNFWKKLGIPMNKKIVLNSFFGITFSNIKDSFTLTTKEPFLLAISRPLLDQYVRELAEKNGAKILTKTKAKKLEILRHGIRTTTTEKEFFSDLVLVADGIFGSISNRLSSKSGKNLLFASQGVFKHSLDPSYPVVILREEISRDFFAYIAPINEDYARVGIATSDFSRIFLLEKIARIFNLKKQEPARGWGIWIGGPAKKLSFYDKVFLLGDAAGFTKATTGGGIVFGSLLARLVSLLVSSSEVGDKMKIEKKIEILKRELTLAFFARKLLNLAGPSAYFPVLKKVSSMKGISNLLESSDYDFLSTFFKQMVRNAL